MVTRVFARALIALLLALFIASSAATDSVCNYGQIGQFVALLQNYPPAQSYCSDLIPPQYTAETVTRTITQCQPNPTGLPPLAIITPSEKRKRHDEEYYHDYEKTSTQTTSTPDPQAAAAFYQLRRSTRLSRPVCTCINTLTSPPPPQATTTLSVHTTCPSIAPCDPTTRTCQPLRTCTNPSRCESSSYCLEAPVAGACFCHPDTEIATVGYCMSSGVGCPAVYEDCAINADCRGGEGTETRVCILACCREQPFCVDLEDYRTDAPVKVAISSRGGDGGGGNSSVEADGMKRTAAGA